MTDNAAEALAVLKDIRNRDVETARQHPAFEQQRLKRIAVNEARVLRATEREAARKVREAELAAQNDACRRTHREAEKAETIAKAQAAERDAALIAEQKAGRDAR